MATAQTVKPIDRPMDKAEAPESKQARALAVRFTYLRDDDDAHREPPFKRYEGDPAYDLAVSSPIPEHFFPKTRRFFHTNLVVAIPQGYVGLILPRASTFETRKCSVHPQLVYPNYRGELMVEVHNVGSHDVNMLPGERIAQLLILPAVQPEWIEVKGEPAVKEEDRVVRAAKPADMGKTDRGDKCGGSTGRRNA